MGQSASFTPRTLTLGAMSTGVKQSNSAWNSQCDRHVRRRLSLMNGHESNARQTGGWVDLVCLVHLVSFVQPNKLDRPNKRNNRLLSPPDSFSILLMVQFVSHSA